MQSKTVEIYILEADPSPNKGGYYRYRCQWTKESGDRAEKWVSSKTAGLSADARYSCTMTAVKRGTFLNITISDCVPVGAPPVKAEPAHAATSDVPSVSALKEVRLTAEVAKEVIRELPEANASVVNTVLAHLLQRGVADRFIAENEQAEDAEPKSELTYYADGSPCPPDLI